MGQTTRDEGQTAADVAQKKISEGQDLLDKILDLEKKHIAGVSKFRKRIQAEIKFLKKGLEKGSELSIEHIQCSNLGQLGAVTSVATDIPNVCGILQTFKTKNDEKLCVDLVANDGKKWIKVIMRNPKALHMQYVLGGGGKAKPLDKVAKEFSSCAKLHPVLYSLPKVVFWFCCGVSEGLAATLENIGVEIKGERIPNDDLGLPEGLDDESDTESEESERDSAETDTGDCDPFFWSFTDEECEQEEISTAQFNTEDLNRLDLDSNSSKSPESSESDCRFTSQKDDGSRQKTLELTEVIIQPIESTGRLNNISSPTPAVHSQGKETCNDVSTPQQQVVTCKNNQDDDDDDETISKINLDVTAMIAYVSSTANGGCNFVFQDKFLTEQAQCERQNPVKEILDAYFKGRELLACEEAVTHFLEIISTLGGAGEKARAQQLVARLTIVPGVDHFKDKIKICGKVRELSRITFGTGHAHRAVTVTSNRGLTRSAAQQGVNLAVLYHRPRALTEAKESTATPLIK